MHASKSYFILNPLNSSWSSWPWVE